MRPLPPLAPIEVTLAGGHVWVNGQLLHEPYIDDVDPDSYLSTRVKDGHFFVLGDNSGDSEDGREWGAVRLEQVIGYAAAVVWPPSAARGLAPVGRR